MPIRFRCPEGHKLNVPDELAGRKARCPKCRRKMYIPLDDADPNQSARAADDARSRDEEETPQSRSAHDWSVDAVEVDDVAEALVVPPAPIPVIYAADPDKVQNARLLSIALAAGALFASGPVAWHVNVFTAPDWARLVLLLTLVQLAFAAWLASFPDWVSVWVAMLVNALVATAYGTVLAIVLHTPGDTPLPLGMEDASRSAAAPWCLCVVLIAGLATFICGRVCAQWRRSDALRAQRKAEVSHAK